MMMLCGCPRVVNGNEATDSNHLELIVSGTWYPYNRVGIIIIKDRMLKYPFVEGLIKQDTFEIINK